MSYNKVYSNLIRFVSFESVVVSSSHNRHKETLQAPLAFWFFLSYCSYCLSFR